jgi:hypothetical protein
MNNECKSAVPVEDRPAMEKIYDKVMGVLDVVEKMSCIVNEKSDRYFSQSACGICEDNGKKGADGMVENILFAMEGIEARVHDAIDYINRV